MREKEIEAKLKKEVEKVGGLALKFISPGVAGVPDRIVLLPYKLQPSHFFTFKALQLFRL